MDINTVMKIPTITYTHMDAHTYPSHTDQHGHDDSDAALGSFPRPAGDPHQRLILDMMENNEAD